LKGALCQGGARNRDEKYTVGNAVMLISNHKPLLFVIAAMALCAGSSALAADDAQSSGAWQGLRASYYANRDIGEVDEALMSVVAPGSTPDPTATPVTIRFGAQAAGKVRQVRVIIDHNPSPVAATMQLAENVPIDEIELRLRIDRATSVRAIAEMNDGSLEMRSAWVNASGGCSAPPSASGAGVLGDIRFRPSSDRKSLQMSIRHPNNSGFQIDPLSGDPIPPHFVSHIRVRAGDKTLLDADTGISLSENPTVRIASERAWDAPLLLEAIDTKNAQYQATWTGNADRSGKR
jgi:sulfur-oxidizing protein SoxY